MESFESDVYDWALNWQMGVESKNQLLDDMSDIMYDHNKTRLDIINCALKNKWYVKSMDVCLQD